MTDLPAPTMPDDRAAPGRSVAVLLAAAAAGLLVGVAVAGALAQSVELGQQHLALAVAALGGLATAYLAVTRFWAFVLVLVAVRPTLDLLHQGPEAGLDPAAAAGLVFIGTAAAWLIVQWLQQTWAPASAVTKSLFALALAGFASTLTSSDPAASAQASFKILAGALMFAVLEQVLRRHPERAAPLLGAFFASALVPLALGVHQLLFAPPDPTDNSLSRVHGTFVHPNSFASFLVLQLVVGVALVPATPRRWRPLLVGQLVVSGLLLVFTYTRGAWLALMVGLLYLGLRHRRAVLVGLLAGVVVVVAAVPSAIGRLADIGDDRTYGGVPANSFSWRVHYWGKIAEMAPESPLTGIGLETVAVRMDERLQPHNVFVQTFVETGAMGLASLVALVVTLTALVRRRRALAVGDWDRTLASAAVAVALTMGVLAVSENLLTSTAVYWYVAAAMTFGLRPGAAHPPEPLAPVASVAQPASSTNGGASG
jgi:putative inorganic carbon (hco3(-)) transporter